MLVVDGTHDRDASAVGSALRWRSVQHCGLDTDSIVHEDGRKVLDVAVREVRDGPIAYILDSDSHRQTQDQRADDKKRAVLALSGVLDVNVRRVRVHREEAEKIVIRFKDGLGRGVLNYEARSEVFVVVADRELWVHSCDATATLNPRPQPLGGRP